LFVIIFVNFFFSKEGVRDFFEHFYNSTFFC